jgi:hypothetical protein
MDAATGRFPNLQGVGKNPPMQLKAGGVSAVDKGGRRSGFERRTFSYTCYIPERRSGQDRRGGQDRRRNKRRSNAPDDLKQIAGPQSDLAAQ